MEWPSRVEYTNGIARRELRCAQEAATNMSTRTSVHRRVECQEMNLLHSKLWPASPAT
jgi:hypothetical protein